MCFYAKEKFDLVILLSTFFGHHIIATRHYSARRPATFRSYRDSSHTLKEAASKPTSWKTTFVENVKFRLLQEPASWQNTIPCGKQMLPVDCKLIHPQKPDRPSIQSLLLSPRRAAANLREKSQPQSYS